MVDLQDYWADHPPVHELVAAYLGVKPRPKFAKPIPGQPGTDAADPSGIGGLVAQFPNGFVPANR